MRYPVVTPRPCACGNGVTTTPAAVNGPSIATGLRLGLVAHPAPGPVGSKA